MRLVNCQVWFSGRLAPSITIITGILHKIISQRAYSPCPGLSVGAPFSGRTLTVLVAVLSIATQLAAQPSVPKYEFRGAWIATVRHLDWPSPGMSPADQMAMLTMMLDRLKDAGINAVFFQVRSESDAMYDSPLEPWSYWLTGEQGRGPDPYYDPLHFAVEEAHERGIELHAWFNPYRADRGSSYAKAASHVTRTHPEWILPFGSLRILDPGRAAVRDHLVGVIMDVVRRYDIDGVHFDDYFYPYPTLTRRFSNEDSVTFSEESRGVTDLNDWRRSNVDLLIAQLADSIRAEKPDIKFGISPFGIRRPGQPFGINGMDAVNQIWADPLAWVKAGTVDYLVPQLYWPFGGAQDYGKLVRWWADYTGGVHLYTGNALHRTDSGTFSRMLFSPEEIPNQLRYNRSISNVLGAVFFRAQSITHFYSYGIVEVLTQDLYRNAVLTPPMEWKVSTPPAIPQNLRSEWSSAAQVILRWDPVPDARRYAVYRMRGDGDLFPGEAVQRLAHLLVVTGTPGFTDRPAAVAGPYYYYVRAVGYNSQESGPSNIVSEFGRALPEGLSLHGGLGVDPRPSRSATDIYFSVTKTGPVAVRIYDIFGMPVRALAEGAVKSPGTYAYRWNGTGASGHEVSRGIYLVIVDQGGQTATAIVGLVR